MRTVHYQQLRRMVCSGSPDTPRLVRLNGRDFIRCGIGWVEDEISDDAGDRYQIIGMPRQKTDLTK